MKNKILTIFSVGLLATLLLPLSVFGAISYERIPAGTEITSPVSFSVSIDAVEDLGLPADNGYWGIILSGFGGVSPNPICVATSTLSNTFIFNNLPVGQGYDYVGVAGGTTLEICQNYGDCEVGNDLEYTTPAPMFSIIETPIPIGVITSGFDENMPDYDMTTTTANIGGLIESTGGLIWLAIGIPLGFYVIKKFLEMIKLREAKVRK